MSFEDVVGRTASLLALGIEILAVAVLVAGSLEAVIGTGQLAVAQARPRAKRDVWLRYAAWIILSLEFALAADIVRSVITPSWDDIGKLGAIAAIRTILNYFLERDIEAADRLRPDRPALDGGRGP